METNQTCPTCFWGTVEQTDDGYGCRCGTLWFPNSIKKSVIHVIELIKREMRNGSTSDCGPQGEKILRSIYNTLKQHGE